MMGLSSIWHWAILLIVVVLVFGTKKLRNVGKDLGGAVHDFKEGLQQRDEHTAVQKKIEEAQTEKESVSNEKEPVSKDESKEV